MLLRRRFLAAAALGLVLPAAGCGDDDPTGPGYGDLELTPGFQEIGAARSTTVLLSNVSETSLGPILIGGSPGLGIGLIADELCPPMLPTVTPSSVGSLAPGADVEISVSFDLAGVTVQDCRAGDYDVDLTAAVDLRGLAGSTIRLSFAGEG